MFRARFASLGMILSTIAAHGCAEDEAPQAGDADSSVVESVDSGADAASTPTDASAPSAAYIVGLRVDAPEDRFIYFGAFPEVPTEEPSRDQMVELSGSWQLTTAYGHVYSWEQQTGEITRWEVGDDLSLTRGQTLSFARQALTGWRHHAFVAPDRAYTLGLESGVVAVWNPETMELLNELHFDVPGDFDDLEAYPLSVFVRGKHIIAPMYGDNFDVGRIATRQIVGFIDTERDQVSFVTDDRCLPSGLGHVTDNGDIYLDPYQSGTYFHLYSDQKDLPPPCELRIKHDETRIDPDYVLDYAEVLGTHADGVWPISSTEVMALAKLPDEALPSKEASDDYWSLPCAAHKVNLETKTAEPYTGLPERLQMQSASQHVVDGRSFYQNYSYNADDLIDVVELGELTSDGWRKQFEINGGDLWLIGRAR
ncbi:MAG: hypothetical protein ABW321_11365 [Polyangiales bacterium]